MNTVISNDYIFGENSSFCGFTHLLKDSHAAKEICILKVIAPSFQTENLCSLSPCDITLRLRQRRSPNNALKHVGDTSSYT